MDKINWLLRMVRKKKTNKEREDKLRRAEKTRKRENDKERERKE
jgi:hypothetical protein